MEVKAELRNRIGILALCVLTGIVGAAVLYGSMFFVLALINYYDGYYKHDTFYALYPTAISYLYTFFTTGTAKHLPGYEIEFNVGLPLVFGCGMIFLGLLLVLLLRRNYLHIADKAIRGKGILRKGFELPLSQLRRVRRLPFGGLILSGQGKGHLFLFLKNRDQILAALAQSKTVP